MLVQTRLNWRKAGVSNSSFATVWGKIQMSSYEYDWQSLIINVSKKTSWWSEQYSFPSIKNQPFWYELIHNHLPWITTQQKLFLPVFYVEIGKEIISTGWHNCRVSLVQPCSLLHQPHVEFNILMTNESTYCIPHCINDSAAIGK